MAAPQEIAGTCSGTVRRGRFLIGIAVPAVTLGWHRSVDEHEEHVYRFAALIALYAYFWASLMWWIAARGGILPPADAKVIFGIVWAVWGVAWAWGKYR